MSQRSRMAIWILFSLLVESATATTARSAPRLWYARPAAQWTEALPLGNGRLGAMLLGGTAEERVQINESTLWGGGPHDYATPQGAELLPKLRELIFAGKAEEAQQLAAGFLGSPAVLMPYLGFCDLYLHFPEQASPTAYRRELRMDEAVARVDYRVGKVDYHREMFVSYPDNVLVMRLTASRPHSLSFTMTLSSPQPGVQLKATGTEVLLSGQVQPMKNQPNTWIASWDQPGLRYAGRVWLRLEGGRTRVKGTGIKVQHATSVTILFSGATSFVNYREIGGDPLASTAETLRKAGAFAYAQLRRRHLEDYRPLFARVSLRLGAKEDERPTDERLRDFAQTGDPSLVALYYQFGRYALLASSRPGGQPANLQGIWNQSLRPAWGSKWTTNINLEMNYWPAESGDLWETEEPLWSLIEDLRASGAETARSMYGARGWVLHHNTDLWRATAPVDGVWGLWPTGGVWLANQMWSHYEFTRDKEFLRRAWPAIKEAARFMLDAMVTAPAGTAVAGRLVTNPSISPENQYLLNGHAVHLTYGPAMDVELIDELLGHCAEAANILGADREFAAEAEAARRRLPPLKIGARGQLQEWIEDYEETEPQHRHVSHLYALYPGSAITLEQTPELAAAARRSLELRGDESTGWAEAWRAALWARLRDGDHAYKMLRTLLATNTLPDMFDVCPPFQIDGNFGGAAAIAEMLVQSHDGSVRLLPALPSAWPEGELRGLRARGGLKLALEWRNGRLTEASVHATHQGVYRVRYGDKSVELSMKAGETVRLDYQLRPNPI
jgi:alpha-L-fucosidase 2